MNTFKDQILKTEILLKELLRSNLEKKLEETISVCLNALRSNVEILVCGNGGSAADSQHIAGELVGKFLKQRRALNVRALTTDTSVITAWGNDVSFETIFSRQVEAYGSNGGILIALSTSGNSKNIINAAKIAKLKQMSVIALTGSTGGKLAEFSDILLNTPSDVTPRIQEMHMMMYHYICEKIEENFQQ